MQRPEWKKGLHLQLGIDAQDGVGAAVGPCLPLGQNGQRHDVGAGQLPVQHRIDVRDGLRRLLRALCCAVAHQVCT